MRIKFNGKIYRLKEIESGVDSLMELVEEYKDGDFLHSDWNGENITIIYRKRNCICLYYHASKSNRIGLDFDKEGFWFDGGDFRLATESEKKELIDALAEVGKRWNADKKCVEDIPKRKFKAGDKVKIKDGISSETHRDIFPCFMRDLDDYIGQKLVINNVLWHTNGVYLYRVNNSTYGFLEDWLEPYTEELKKGDLAIFWDGFKDDAIIKIYNKKEYGNYYDNSGVPWDNAIKFESKEQYEKVLRGEI